ncbi:RidA family protein [uncultured Tateyamaria sp.]|uniref:RidA family protein n=1 Tax=uncultured Tateyamaria sp. TaxID=455651 RepID=UPI002622C44A|nr:RidA family protein [uncultured Tateyamaria sp.]
MKKTEHRAIVPDGMQDLVQNWRMSPAIVSGDHVFLTGFNGCPLDGPPPTDPVAQMRIVFDTVSEVLAADGLDWSAVVDMTSFHVGLRDHLEDFKAIRAEYVCQPYPAWTAIEVAGFATDGVIVELKVVARLSEVNL